MEKDIAQGKIGEKASYDIEFKGGKLVAKLDAEPVAGVVGKVELALDADAVLGALKKAIPGAVDDVVFDLIGAALKA